MKTVYDDAEKAALEKRVSELSGSQARIALAAIISGIGLKDALRIAESYPPSD